MYWNEEWNMKYGNGKQGHWKQHLGAICVQMCSKILLWAYLGTSQLENTNHIASSPGHSQILSHSCGEKSGEGLGLKLSHGPEMVDLVST